MWRTLEIRHEQAVEMSTWYTNTVESQGAGWGPLVTVAAEVYERVVHLGLMLGVLKEGSNGETCVTERERV